MKNTLLAAIAALLLLSTSCVSNKKYMEARRSAHLDSMELAARLANAQKELANSRSRNGELEGKLGQVQASNEFTTGQLNQSQEEIARQRQRMQQLQALIDQQRKNTEALRQKMAEAMKGFSSDQLSVFVKNGKVYVSMQESLLFPSGSAEVNPKGREALGTLSQALNQNPDINVMVEGHTDSIPITKRYEDNWALSVARSTAITRVLIKDYNVAPPRITATGRSSYEPIADNSTPEGRARNRRTEIILAPKLDELMNLIQGGGDAAK